MSQNPAGRLSWRAVDQTHNERIQVSLGSHLQASLGGDVWNTTWLFFTGMAQNFCRKTIISCLKWFHHFQECGQCRKCSSTRGWQKGTLVSCRCPPQGQSCPTSAPQCLWKINPSTQTYFIGVFLFSLTGGCFFALLTQDVPHSPLEGCAHILLLSSKSRQPCFKTQCRCWVIAVHLSATLFTNLKNLTARKLLVKGHHKSSHSPHSECAGCNPILAAGQLIFNVTQKRI